MSVAWDGHPIFHGRTSRTPSALELPRSQVEGIDSQCHSELTKTRSLLEGDVNDKPRAQIHRATLDPERAKQTPAWKVLVLSLFYTL